ncbi:hypothetical protein WOLCODRAFT_29777, partial [Wolfiporia cocos MD-104 SS10]
LLRPPNLICATLKAAPTRERFWGPVDGSRSASDTRREGGVPGGPSPARAPRVRVRAFCTEFRLGCMDFAVRAAGPIAPGRA